MLTLSDIKKIRWDDDTVVGIRYCHYCRNYPVTRYFISTGHPAGLHFNIDLPIIWGTCNGCTDMIPFEHEEIDKSCADVFEIMNS